MPKPAKPAKIKVADADTEPVEVEVEVKTAPELPPIETADPETDKIVDEIAAQDSDALLAAEDEDRAAEEPKRGWRSRLKHGLTGWWHHPTQRRLVLAVIVISLLATAITPASRYFVLNTAGVRSTALVVVVDDSTQQPLKNVEVTLGNQTGLTDKEGKANFRHVRLGKTKLVTSKRAFAKEEKSVTIGWGSNPLEPVSLEPVGSQYRFIVTDYLSGQPVADAEATSGEASALSDAEGEITITLDTDGDAQTAEVTVNASGYRSENLALDLNNRDAIQLELVPAKPHIFISKRSGRYDVYKVDADGQNEDKILAGSGVERDDIVLVPHPSKDFAALVSTRENVRQDGFLLSTLTLVDINTKTPSKLAQSERIQIIDWVGDRLVYVQIAAGASGSDPQRHRLMSYDLASGQTKELAAANYFNDVLAVNGQVYYAPSALYATGSVAFYRLAADGSGKQTLVDQEIWNVFRTSYDKLVITGDNNWFEYQINANKTTPLGGEPAGLSSRIYTNSLDGKRSLWVDQRDGKGVLLAYDIAQQSDKILHSQSGLAQPVRWLSDSALVFRVSTTQETADYVISLDGGEPKKLMDVTDTAGIDRWYFY